MNTITRTVTNDDDEEVEVNIPFKWEICGNCHGGGQHAHAIDGNGITSSEWAEWDQDERETYMSGGYDSSCEDCHGSGKIKVEDWDSLPEDIQKALQREADCDRDIRLTEAAERRFGC